MSRAQLCGWAAFVTFCYNTDEAALAMLLARPRCSSARLPETCTSNTDSLREDIPMAQETPYRKLPQQARGQQRIARLLDAAECVFAAVGYDAATTNAIAAQANTSIGSLYQFFPNKEALLTALAGRYLAELRDTLDQTLTPETTELPLADFLDCILGALGSFLGEHTSFRPLFISARHPGHTKDEVANAAYELRQEVVLRIDGLLALRAPSLAEVDRLL